MEITVARRIQAKDARESRLQGEVIAMGKMLDLFFGCRHHRITRPITPVDRRGSIGAHTYVACLECGKQFYYDTRAMTVGKPVPQDLVNPCRAAGQFQTQY